MPNDRRRRAMPAVLPTVVPLEGAGQVADHEVDVAHDAITAAEICALRRELNWLRTVAPIEAQVVCWSFGIGGPRLSRREAADRLGYSPSGVQEILKRGVARLRDHRRCA